MNWDAIGAIGEVVGALATVATLGYLAIQIRANTRAARASTNRAISEQRNEINFRFGFDPSSTDLLLRGAEGHADLEPHERFRFTLLMRAILGMFEDVQMQFTTGMSDAETWELGKSALCQDVLSAPGFAGWWKENRALFRAEFCAEIDELLRSTPLNKAQWWKRAERTMDPDFVTELRGTSAEDNAAAQQGVEPDVE